MENLSVEVVAGVGAELEAVVYCVRSECRDLRPNSTRFPWLGVNEGEGE